MGQGVVVGVVALILIALIAPWVRTAMVRGLVPDGGFLIRRSRGGAIDVRGRVPRSKVREIQEFCSRNLASDRPFTIRGTWGPGRSFEPSLYRGPQPGPATENSQLPAPMSKLI